MVVPERSGARSALEVSAAVASVVLLASLVARWWRIEYFEGSSTESALGARGYPTEVIVRIVVVVALVLIARIALRAALTAIDRPPRGSAAKGTLLLAASNLGLVLVVVAIGPGHLDAGIGISFGALVGLLAATAACAAAVIEVFALGA